MFFTGYINDFFVAIVFCGYHVKLIGYFGLFVRVQMAVGFHGSLYPFIDYDTLLQAVWNNAETVYSYRTDGEHEFSMDYRGTELFKQRATLLYEDMGDGFAGAVVVARSMELWLLEDMGFVIVANFYVEVGNDRLCSRLHTYEDVISRNNLWGYFSKNKEKAVCRTEKCSV